MQLYWAVFANNSCNTICGRGEPSTYAVAAYSSTETREMLARFGIADCVQRKG